MNNLIKIGLGLSLAIVYPFMVGFGIEAFFPQPKQEYEACRHLEPTAYMQKETSVNQEDYIPNPQKEKELQQCYDKAQEQTDIYNRNMFLITTVLAFIAIAVGTLLFSEKMGPVGPGLVFGGLFTIIYGTGRSFRSIDKTWIFMELLIVFVGLILITWRYLKVNRQLK